MNNHQPSDGFSELMFWKIGCWPKNWKKNLTTQRNFSISLYFPILQICAIFCLYTKPFLHGSWCAYIYCTYCTSVTSQAFPWKLAALSFLIIDERREVDYWLLSTGWHGWIDRIWPSRYASILCKLIHPFNSLRQATRRMMDNKLALCEQFWMYLLRS